MRRTYTRAVGSIDRFAYHALTNDTGISIAVKKDQSSVQSSHPPGAHSESLRSLRNYATKTYTVSSWPMLPAPMVYNQKELVAVVRVEHTAATCGVNWVGHFANVSRGSRWCLLSDLKEIEAGFR